MNADERRPPFKTRRNETLDNNARYNLANETRNEPAAIYPRIVFFRFEVHRKFRTACNERQHSA